MNKVYKLQIKGNNVQIVKAHRTRTQFEYKLTIFMGDSDWESILLYQAIHLTLKGAKNEAVRAITKSKQARIEKVA